MKKALLAVTLLMFWASSAVAQRDGISTFSVADTHEVDTINLTSLVPSFNFLGLSKGKGSLPGSFVLEAPGNCFVATLNNNQFWSCGNTSGYTTPLKFQLAEAAAMSINFTGPTSSAGCTKWQIFGMFGSDGITYHPFSSSSTHVLWTPSTCGPQTVTLTTVDNSGYTVAFSTTSGALNTTSIYNTSGWLGGGNGSISITDPFSNSISASTVGSTTTFTDSLGAATTITGSQDSGDPTNYAYTDTGGNTQNIALTTGSAQSFIPLGSSSCVNYPATPFTVHPVTKITYPDSTTVGITWATNGTGISGLIGSVTLRTGGQISYTYTGASTGCGPLTFTGLTRATPDGNTTYAVSVNGTTYTTTVKDPGLNKTVYAFYVPAGGPSFITQVDRYQNTGTVASPSYTHISEDTYCYQSTCSTTPSYPITQTQVDKYLYTSTGTSVHMSQDIKTYDSTYGLMLTDADTDEITSQTITKTIVYGTYASGSCSAITNTNIVDHPCTATTKNGTTWLSENTYTYNSNGALTSSAACLNSTCSSALTTTYTPTTHGTYSAIQDPNGQTVNYTYGSCNSLMPTDVTTTVNSIAIDRKATWNCNAGLVTDTTDPNSNEADYTYDSMNRLSTYHDYMGDTNTTSYAYGTPTLDHVKVTDNIGVVRYQYNDSLGRLTVGQVCQTSGCSNLDTSSKSYAWNGVNFETKTYVPCVQTVLNTPCTTIEMTADSNPIAGRILSTNANNGTLTYTINSKDSSVTAGPAPSGENTKVVQTEVDGFGRTTSTCALEASGGTACGQTMGNAGILTSNVYSFATGAPKVVTTRGSQSHTIVADTLGRTTSITLPETGSTARTFTYDSQSTTDNCTGSGGRNSYGDMLRNNLPDGSNYICYNWDGLHRFTDAANSIVNSTHPCKRFRYDSTANNAYTKPTGYPSSGANLVGRLMEASTDDCTFPLAQAHMITDEWFAYDAMGRMTDMWETTPNSSGFYHTTVAYDADGNVTSISGIPGSSAYTFTMDGEGRPYNSKLGSTWIVGSSSTTGVTYDSASRPLTVPLSTGTTNSDTYTYDSLGNMTKYTFASGSTTMVGQLTWSSIGSLRELNITDGFNSGGTQDCKFGTSTVIGYDDVGRLLDANCGSTIFHNSFSYDQYDNLTQTGSLSWNPGYSSTNNQMTGSSYDTNGNVTYDGVNTYATNVYGKLANVRAGSSGAVCGTSGTCVTYDALDRIVEVNVAGTYSQVLYSPLGRVARMNGQTTASAQIAQPGGGATYVSSSMYFLHPDWLGTKRLSTLMSTGAFLFDTAYAPYSQEYDNFGNLTPQDFTGDLQDIFPGGLFDTPNRELFVNSGRWLSPDPAHSGWNAYAYVTNPNTQTDPSGLCLACPPAPWGSPFSASFGSFGFLDINPNGGPPKPDSSTGMNDAFSMALAFANQNVDDYNNRVSTNTMFAYLRRKDQGYMSDDEIALTQRIRAGITRELERAMDGEGNIIYRDNVELEEAVYRAMELADMGADDPAGLVTAETLSIRQLPDNADAIRTQVDEIAHEQLAMRDFNDPESGGGTVNMLPFLAQPAVDWYGHSMNPSTSPAARAIDATSDWLLNPSTWLRLLNALGDTTYSQH